MVARSSALVADDDDFFRIALRNILTDELRVPEVIETASLDEAIDALGSDTSIDLALFDLNMPGMNSFDGIKATRETFPDVTVVVVSASTDRRDVLRSLDAGAHGFVPKGEGVRRLVQAVRFVVDGNVYVPNFLPRLNGPPAAD